MSKELVISSNAHETKVAIVEEDQLTEIYFQRANEYSLAGSIHKGRVTRVLPGMQSAFVDLGLERDTFLYVSDFFEENGDEYDRIPEDRQQQSGRRQDRVERPERGQRFERPERHERHEAPVQPPPPALVQPPPPGVSEEPADLSAEESKPAPVIERVEDDGRDRRGRRSRRRRSRGRGFPESKYASDLSTAEAETEPETETETVDTEEPAEVFLLPGESLAKYRSRPASDNGEQTEALDQAELEEADGEEIEVPEPEVLEPEVPETDAVAVETAAEDEPEAPEEPEPVAAAAVEPELAVDEPAADETVDDAAEPEAEPEVEAASAITPEPVDEAEALDADEEADEDAIDTELSGGFTTEDFEEITPDPLEDVEPLTVDEADIDAVETATPAAEGLADEQPLAASVREQSGRYQHRQSRRMRRKQRGEGRQEHQREAAPAPAPEPETRASRVGEKPPMPSISDLLREGQEIIVQIAKEPLGQKGARITSHIALPGRFVVFMPTLEHLGVSRKIASDEERQRLKRILQSSRAGITGGFIVRTAGEGRSEEEIAADMAYLYNLWLDIRAKAEKRKAPVLLHHDLDIVHRILRDQLSDMFKAVWIDNEEVYESVLRFMQRFQPSLVGRVKMYTRPIPIFDGFGITQEIEKALRPKVWLKSGGYIVINQTEALVAIDVNTGKYVGKSNRLEDTITRTNTEAVKEIVRQIRLRDLGGIIVIDFIDMDERKNRQKVMQALEEAMRADRAPYKILQFNDFGLVAITRKRVKQSLERSLCSPCPVCEGAGYTKSVPTVVGEILQEATKIRQNVEGKNVVLRVYPEVAKFLKSNSNDQLEEIESILGRPVMVMSDPMLHPEKFDLAW